MQSLFLTEYIKSSMFLQDLSNELLDHDVNFDLIISDINYSESPALLITPENKPNNVSLIDSWIDAINTSKHPLIILNELNSNSISPIFALKEKQNITIINVNTWLWSYGKKLSPETKDLDIVPNEFDIFEPIDLENFRNILKKNWKQYIRLLHKELPSAIFDVDELWIIDSELLKNLDLMSLKTYWFAWNDWTILVAGSLFATAIQTWEMLQNHNKQLNMFILQKLNSKRSENIIDGIKNTQRLFILIDHNASDNIKNRINKRLNNLGLTNIQVNIIAPKYEKLTTIFNEYQEEQSNFDPEHLTNRIISEL